MSEENVGGKGGKREGKTAGSDTDDGKDRDDKGLMKQMADGR
jgi:hypothetical protein